MLDDAQRNAALRAAKLRAAKLKYLEPPNICDVPFARRLDRSCKRAWRCYCGSTVWVPRSSYAWASAP